jgi:hypothetical protein
MNESVSCRDASKADLPEVLHLYAQPAIDDGQVLSLFDAERLFERRRIRCQIKKKKTVN